MRKCFVYSSRKDGRSDRSQRDFYYSFFYEKSYSFRILFTKALLWDIVNNNAKKRRNKIC